MPGEDSANDNPDVIERVIKQLYEKRKDLLDDHAKILQDFLGGNLALNLTARRFLEIYPLGTERVPPERVIRNWLGEAWIAAEYDVSLDIAFKLLMVSDPGPTGQKRILELLSDPGLPDPAEIVVHLNAVSVLMQPAPPVSSPVASMLERVQELAESGKWDEMAPGAYQAPFAAAVLALLAAPGQPELGEEAFGEFAERVLRYKTESNLLPDMEFEEPLSQDVVRAAAADSRKIFSAAIPVELLREIQIPDSMHPRYVAAEMNLDAVGLHLLRRYVEAVVPQVDSTESAKLRYASKLWDRMIRDYLAYLAEEAPTRVLWGEEILSQYRPDSSGPAAGAEERLITRDMNRAYLIRLLKNSEYLITPSGIRYRINLADSEKVIVTPMTDGRNISVPADIQELSHGDLIGYKVILKTVAAGAEEAKPQAMELGSKIVGVLAEIPRWRNRLRDGNLSPKQMKKAKQLVVLRGDLEQQASLLGTVPSGNASRDEEVQGRAKVFLNQAMELLDFLRANNSAAGAEEYFNVDEALMKIQALATRDRRLTEVHLRVPGYPAKVKPLAGVPDWEAIRILMGVIGFFSNPQGFVRVSLPATRPHMIMVESIDEDSDVKPDLVVPDPSASPQDTDAGAEEDSEKLLQRKGVPSRVIKILRKHGIPNISAIRSKSVEELSDLEGFSLEDLKMIYRAALDKYSGSGMKERPSNPFLYPNFITFHRFPPRVTRYLHLKGVFTNEELRVFVKQGGLDEDSGKRGSLTEVNERLVRSVAKMKIPAGLDAEVLKERRDLQEEAALKYLRKKYTKVVWTKLLARRFAPVTEEEIRTLLVSEGWEQGRRRKGAHSDLDPEKGTAYFKRRIPNAAAGGAEEVRVMPVEDPNFWKEFGAQLSFAQLADVGNFLDGRDRSRVEVTAVTGISSFFLHTDSALKSEADQLVENYPVQGIDIRVSDQLRSRPRTPEAFEKPGLMLPGLGLGSFDWPEGVPSPVRITEPIDIADMPALRPTSWIALQYNPRLTVEHILTQNVLVITYQNAKRETVVLIFA